MEQEHGNCMMCGASGIVHKKFYYYGIQCECHSPEHFEIVYHCQKCTPKSPDRTMVYFKKAEGSIYEPSTLMDIRPRSGLLSKEDESFKNQLLGEFVTHDYAACDAYREYDANINYIGRSGRNPYSYMREVAIKYGVSVDRMREHGGCFKGGS